MNKIKYPLSIKNCQYAIYPSYNIYEPLEIKKKQIFERILIHLRNKFMSLMTENSYKYHSLRADTKCIFDRLDVLNRKFDSLLPQVEGLILKRITNSSQNKDSNKHKINNSSSCTIKRVDESEKISLNQKNNSPVKNLKKAMPFKINSLKMIKSKTSIEVKHTQSHSKTKNQQKIKINHSLKKVSKKRKEKENDFLERFKERYVSMEKNDHIEFKERIRNYHLNVNDNRRLLTESNGFITSLRKSSDYSPSKFLEKDFKKNKIKG